MNRIDNYERMYLGEKLEMPDAASRIDALWQAILNGEELPFEPVIRVEKYLAKMIDSSIETPSPTTRLEEILCAICNGEKVDKATKNACKDEYLKYIYEFTSGENMFVPNTPTPDGITFDGRRITINGHFSEKKLWQAQVYKFNPFKSADIVTIRYKYISGSVNKEGYSLGIAPFVNTTGEIFSGTSEQIYINNDNYSNDVVVVTKINSDVTFGFLINVQNNATFDNLTFEVSFEKGDTTK